MNEILPSIYLVKRNAERRDSKCVKLRDVIDDTEFGIVFTSPVVGQFEETDLTLAIRLI